MTVQLLLLMGVSGSGKTTIGSLLAADLGWEYADADSFHSAANVEKMARGQALTDEDREPWLAAIRAWIDQRVSRREPGVVSCSALKRKYRDVLRRPEVTVVYLRGTQAQIEARLAARSGHFFKPNMLDSQFAVLEEPAADEGVISVAITGTPAEVVATIIANTGARS